ncbi:odorant receptor 22c isoform X2 [Solenopsis invicta]|uniref:odorant receptor 22c isoform X2 n=1 Tax=Solenopsis invicta TaxID=13686 RepID=UPI00193D154C|nr:odorant receptor 22c isoform X2 [Solenopsis invicta]
MSFFDNHYYYPNKILLSIIGQWPFQSRLEGNIMFAVTFISFVSYAFIEIWGLIAGISDLNIIMENFSPFLVLCYLIINLLYCAFTKDKMKVFLENIEETWKMKPAGPEKEILQCYAEKSRAFTIQFVIALYVTFVFYTMPSGVARWMYKLFPTNETYRGKFMYRIEHVLDMDKYFNLLMLHGTIAVFFMVSVAIGVTTVFTLCTLHICALFECIRYNVECIRSTDPVLLEPNIKDDEMYHDLIACIKSYKHALKLSDILTSTYTFAFFFHLGDVVISMSFGAAELILVDIELDAILRIVICNLAQLFHMYCLCMISQKLTDHSSGVHDVIYSCDWYRMSLRSRRLVMLTLMRSNKPYQIKAAKMFVMSMETFSSILKASLSYFTVLTSMQTD